MRRVRRMAGLILEVLSVSCLGVVGSCGRDAPTASLLSNEPLPTQRGQSVSWSMMTDAQLVGAVVAADGEVFIGLKEPGRGRGVGPRGERLLDRTQEAQFKHQLRGMGIAFRREYALIPAVHAVLPAHLAAAVRRLPFVDYVEPIVPGERLGQDTTWNVRRVRAPEAWSVTKGGSVKVLIIDSGIMQGHEDVVASVMHACDGSNGYDQFGHGTFVAGIVSASDNYLGIVGGGPQLQLYSGKDGNSDPNPAYTACEVEWGRQQGVKVINISTGWTESFTALTDQINGAYGEGRLIVAAAGNNNGGAVMYPASLPNVIAVGATTQSDLLAYFSAVGQKIELVAPGAGVESTTLTSDQYCGIGWLYGTCSGTSFSAPHVAFAAALVWAANPTWSNEQVRTRLQETARDLGPAGRDSQYGYGLVDVANAVVGSPPAGNSVAIDGPMCLYQEGDYNYTAQSSGLPAPITYTWHRDIAPYDGKWEFLAGGQNLVAFFAAGSYGAQLKVRATSGSGAYVESIMYVYMTSGGSAAPRVLMSPRAGDGHREAKICAPPPEN